MHRNLKHLALIGLAAVTVALFGPPFARAFAGVDGDARQLVTISADRDAASAEVLCPSSGTALLATAGLTGRRSVSFQNLGPNNIFVLAQKAALAAPTTATVLASGKRILPGDDLPRDARAGISYYCAAVTAIQVTGAGTRVEELQ